MTWGEVKLACLKLMFSNETAELTVDDANQEYINAMPEAANAALNQITQVGVPLRNKLTVKLSKDAAEVSLAEDVLTIPVQENAVYHVYLPEVCRNFRGMEDGYAYVEQGGQYGRFTEYLLENGENLVFRSNEEETITLYYLAYPERITALTEDAQEIDVTRDAAELMPLYMAGELYKDDSLAMAVQFRNQYEDGLVKLQSARNTKSSGGGYQNQTGWW